MYTISLISQQGIVDSSCFCWPFKSGSSVAVLLYLYVDYCSYAIVSFHYVYLTASSFCTSGRLCFLIVTFPKSLRKHAYSNILKILPPKEWKFEDKNSDIFHISAQNIDCGYSLEPPRRGGSNEYPQSMFLSRNKKNNVYPCKPQFYYIKVRFKGVKII